MKLVRILRGGRVSYGRAKENPTNWKMKLVNALRAAYRGLETRALTANGITYT